MLPLRETCYLLGALGLSGGEREMDQIVLCSCSGWDMALHVAVCNFSLVGVQGLICRGLVSCLTAALCVPCLAQPRTSPGEPDVSLAMIYSLPEEAGWLVTG